MLAVNVQQSTLDQALVFYQKHLELQREQQENSLLRNGKAAVTAEDLSVDRAFDEQLQAIAALLDSTNKTPPKATQQIKTPSIDHHIRYPTQQPRVLDEVDTEPYVNPFTGQLITPQTPFSAGTSRSHINAKIPHWDRHEPHILNNFQQSQTVAIVQQPVPQDLNCGVSTIKSSPNPDVGRSRPPSYRSIESVQSFDTRSTVPPARAYASESAVSEAAPIIRSRWGTISRLKHMSSKASFRIRSKNHTECLQKDGVSGIFPGIDHAAVAEVYPTVSLVTTATKVDLETSGPSLDHHLEPESLDSITKDNQTRFQKNRQVFRRRESLAPSSQPAIATEPPFPPIKVLRSTSNGANSTQFGNHQNGPIAETPRKWVDGPLAPEIHARNPVPPEQYNLIYPIQSTAATSVNQKARPTIHEKKKGLEKPFPVASRPARSGVEPPAAEHLDYSEILSELDPYEESLKLALKLSSGFPQDYASLKQIQEEHQISAEFMESQRLARELACGSPQDYTATTWPQAENENIFEKLRLADIERENIFEADHRLAQNLAAEDTLQQIQDFHRTDGDHQLKLQEEARIAKEIAEREDRAEIEAQLAIARRLQEEWNASETNHIEEEQRMARELSEREDRLEFEFQNAELQRLQEEWGHPQSTQRNNASVTPLNADMWTTDRPPAYIAQTPPPQVQPGPSGRGADASGHLAAYSSAPERNRQNPKAVMKSSRKQQQGPTNPVSSRDAEELARIIAERRARNGQWKDDVQKANQAAKEAENAIRRRAKEDEEEIRKLEQQQRLLVEKAKKEEEARRAAIEAERRARQAECTVCTEPVDKSEMATLSCKHAYCAACIEQTFQLAFKEKKPFRCCRNRIPVDSVARFLPNNFVASYRDLVLELDTPNPTYCSKSSCSAFVPPPSIQGDTATCPRCHTNTCKACKGREHPGSICAEDTNGQKLMNLAGSKKWQQCPHCKTLMEKESGCLHMTCRCGTQSCYNCGGLWGSCGGACPRR